MPGILRPVTALLLATAILQLGGGLIGVLLPIRSGIEGFSDFEYGLVGAGYYAGLLVGCFVGPIVIGRVGHIRAFTVFAALVSTTPLVHAIWAAPPAWVLLRAVNGVCFAGILLVIESWLSNASDETSRGRILGIYTLIHLLVVTFGMQLINVAPPAGFELFSLVSILFALAAMPIALTLTIAPAPPSRPRLRLGWLYMVSPAAVLTAALTGITNGAFWMLAPIYAQKSGLSIAQVALFAATGVIGGALSQWPVGSLSDRYGRRILISVLAAVAGVCGILLVLAPDGSGWLRFVLIALFGAANFPIYTLALAHANDLVHKKRAVEVSGGLLLIFSIGAIIGPLAGSLAMTEFGYRAVFAATALAHLSIVGIVFVRSQVRPKLPSRHREDFVLVPRTTPAVYELDPRSEPVPDLKVPPPSGMELAAPPEPEEAEPDQPAPGKPIP